MKRISPLAQLKGKKIKKFDDGGYVDADYEFVDEGVIPTGGEFTVDPETGDVSVDYGDFDWAPSGDVMATQNDYDTTDADALAQIYLTAAQQGGVDPQELIGALVQYRNDTEGLTNQLEGLLGTGALTPKAPVEEANVRKIGGEGATRGMASAYSGDGRASWEQYQSMSPEQRQMYDTWIKGQPTSTGRQGFSLTDPKTGNINWGSLLQLGLVGVGGLAAYSGAKKNNAALKDYYSALEQQRADQQQWMADQQAQTQKYFVPTGALPRIGGTFRSPV